LLATDLADWFVRKGVAFREAHHLVGAAVALAESRKVPITKLTLREWRKISPVFEPSALEVFSVEKGLQARTMPGSPNSKLVKQQLGRWQQILAGRKRSQ
jgi:argininosuccinate lyase